MERVGLGQRRHSVSEAPHILVLMTWVTWVYFPILFSLFSPGEEEGLVTTCRKSGTLGIFPTAGLCLPVRVLIQTT